MRIPWQELAPETLANLLESVVLREGTDYGEQELSFDEKVAQLHNKLKRGEAVMVYSELHETVDIVPPEQVGANENEVGEQ